MLTPAQQHWDRVMAERRGDPQQSQAAMTAYEQILYRLRIDQSRLKAVQSMVTRAEMKREMLPAYLAWVDGTVEADTGQADEVVMTTMIWLLDVGDHDRALQVADYVLRHRLPLPDQYRRTTGTLLVDEICDPALTAFSGAQEPVTPVALSTLRRLAALTDGEDMPDEVRAKLQKTLAYTLRNSAEVADRGEALTLLQQALTLHAGVGVKRDIELLDRQLKKAASASDAPTPRAQARGPAKKAATKTPARRKRSPA